MTYTTTERNIITEFHSTHGKIDSTNINELAARLNKTAASVRAVASRAGLYTAKAPAARKAPTASIEATEIAQYISRLAAVNLDSLATIDINQLRLLRAYIQAINF